MKNFKIKTKTVFENIYLIDANSVEEAVKIFRESFSTTFVQKHLKEYMVSIKTITDPQKELKILEKNGYI